MLAGTPSLAGGWSTGEFCACGVIGDWLKGGEEREMNVLRPGAMWRLSPTPLTATEIGGHKR
jgi:hypothetical protein